jgi:hypothetical protein
VIPIGPPLLEQCRPEHQLGEQQAQVLPVMDRSVQQRGVCPASRRTRRIKAIATIDWRSQL